MASFSVQDGTITVPVINEPDFNDPAWFIRAVAREPDLPPLDDADNPDVELRYRELLKADKINPEDPCPDGKTTRRSVFWFEKAVLDARRAKKTRGGVE